MLICVFNYVCTCILKQIPLTSSFGLTQSPQTLILTVCLFWAYLGWLRRHNGRSLSDNTRFPFLPSSLPVHVYILHAFGVLIDPRVFAFSFGERASRSSGHRELMAQSTNPTTFSGDWSVSLLTFQLTPIARMKCITTYFITQKERKRARAK